MSNEGPGMTPHQDLPQPRHACTVGWRQRLVAAITTAPLVLCTGCLRIPHENPAFPVSREVIRIERSRMREQPATLSRPVIVLGGYRAPPQSANHLAGVLCDLTSSDEADFLAISYPFGSDLNAIAAEVTRRVEECYPSADPDQTVAVDVVGISMGGLIGRIAAMPPGERPGAEAGDGVQPAPASGKRLDVRRIWTLATPHRGALLAKHITLDPASRAMRPDSPYLQELNAALNQAPYELMPYAVLRDSWVGARRTAPPGRDPFWTAGTLMFSHFAVSHNRPIVTDIALRLRGETPLAQTPSEPPRN